MCIRDSQYLGQDIRRETDVPLRMIKTVKDKLTRLENISMHFESGNVYISKDIDLESRDYLIEQLINNKPSHDDLRDALILCLEESQRALTVA
jgi:predicted phage terminase large subunit-like protein